MIRRLEMLNAGPFRGEHAIDLGPGAYALVARHDADRARSNALGKSFVLEAINFLVTGGWRRERAYDADGWITHGEKEGRCVLVLEDGTRVERWKRRGQPRQVRVTLPGRGEAAQDEAAAALLRHLGLEPGDFAHACYLQQKDMARVIHADPGDRLGVVTGWLGLAAGERAEERAGEIAIELGRDVDRLAAERAALTRVNADDGPLFSEAALRDEVEQRRSDVARLERRAKDHAAAERARRVVEEQDERVRRGKALRAEVDKIGDGVEAAAEAAAREVAKAATSLDAARADMRARGRVALGLFDGRCPVAGIACPVTDEINADRKSAQKRLREAEAKAGNAGAAHAKAIDTATPKIEAMRVLDAARARLDDLRAEVREWADEAERARELLTSAEPGDGAAIEEQLARARDELRAAEVALRTTEAERAQRERAATELIAVEARLADATARHRRALKAKATFRAATRRVAERALAAIEDGTNAALAETGVDLSVRARWEREGKGLSRACEECGAAFPTSAKVKTCERCGTARGYLQTQRLDFVLSDSSGGYDDLAGVAWGLAAGSWLLARRQSPWSTCMLDEPTGALDLVARRGLVRYLGRLTAAGAYRQLLVIAHSADVLDALPRRIVVSCAADGARRLEVV